jgi:hypothetical protein
MKQILFETASSSAGTQYAGQRGDGLFKRGSRSIASDSSDAKKKVPVLIQDATLLQESSFVPSKKMGEINEHILRLRKLCSNVTSLQNRLISLHEKLGSCLFTIKVLTESDSSLHNPSASGGFSSELSSLEKRVTTYSSSIRSLNIDLGLANDALTQVAPLPAVSK